jgi:hypothetical protein
MTHTTDQRGAQTKRLAILIGEDNAGSYVSYWNPGPERRAQKITFAKISTDDNGNTTIEDRQESWV